MHRLVRRLRGGVLRVALHRPTAVAVGLLLLAPLAVIWAADPPWQRWWIDALALLAGATGVALLLAGLGGRRPDWEA